VAGVVARASSLRRASAALVWLVALAASACSTATEPRATAPGAPETTRAAARPAPTASGPAAARYVFPVQPSTVAAYGRGHHDYPATDIFAPCGTRVVAPAAGTVQEVSRTDRWRPTADSGATRGGLSVSIVGGDGVRYYGSHLAAVAPGLAAGDHVRAGEPIGSVGRTGSARGTGCHLHFGLSPACGPGDWAVRRGVVDPWPYLDAWRRGRPRSPAAEVARWRSAHRPC
jgi:peptidoglycan LD-endopeptidase LytH